MENKITPELLEKAGQAKSADELIALAEENGSELTGEQAAAYFERLHGSGELSDEELDNVSGGCGDYSYKRTSMTCMKCQKNIVSVTNKKTGEKWCECGCGKWC